MLLDAMCVCVRPRRRQGSTRLMQNTFYKRTHSIRELARGLLQLPWGLMQNTFCKSTHFIREVAQYAQAARV